MEMLNIDKKLVKQYKPDGIVIDYYKSPCKTTRIIRFDDNTSMMISTKDTEGFSILQKQLLMNDYCMDILQRHEDKEGRVIRIYRTVPLKEKFNFLAI